MEESTTVPPAPTVFSDLKRIAPVWVLVIGAALIALFSIKTVSKNYLSNAIVSNQSGCEYAEIEIEKGRTYMSDLRELAAINRLENVSGGDKSLTDDSLGTLKGNSDVSQAIHHFKEAARLCQATPVPNYFLSILYWYDGQPASAYTALAHANLIENRRPSAYAFLRTALDLNPEYIPARISLARLYAQDRDYPQAIELVQNREDEIAETTGGKIALGTIYRRNDQEKAEEYFKAGLQEDPTDVNAIIAVKELIEARGNYEEAGDYVYNLMESSPIKEATIYHQAYFSYRRAGNLEKQEKAIRATYELANRNASVMFDLALVLHNQGKKSEAKDVLKRAMDLDMETIKRRIKSSDITPGE